MAVCVRIAIIICVALCSHCLGAGTQPATAPAVASSGPATRPVVEIFTLGATSAGQPAGFRLTRTGSTGGALDVHLQTMPGRAVPDLDYKLPKSVVIPTGASEAKAVVPTAKPAAPRWGRAFAVEIVPDDHYQLGRHYCDRARILGGPVVLDGPGDAMFVNNDDDNGNGIPDLQELGQIENEDDLRPLTLSFPDNPPPGTEIFLGVTGNVTRIWESADKSGRLLIGPGQSRYTWTVGRNLPLPHIVWAEAITPSVVVNSTRFELGAKEPPLAAWTKYPEPLAALYPLPATKPATQPSR